MIVSCLSARDDVRPRVMIVVRPRVTPATPALLRDPTAHLHGDLRKFVDVDVTGSCDVISSDHFVRGFSPSSFRRCRRNFLVLKKGHKTLIHNLSTDEKLGQSTHWIMAKK